MTTQIEPGAGVELDELRALETNVANARDSFVADLERLVNTDCGSYTKTGVDWVGRWTADFLRGQDAYPPEDYRQDVARHSVRPREDGRLIWKWDPALRGGPSPVAGDHWAALRAIRCPTLVVRGAESPILPRPLADRMIRELADGRLVEASRSGHAVQEDNAPALIAAVREFLGRPAAR